MGVIKPIANSYNGNLKIEVGFSVVDIVAVDILVVEVGIVWPVVDEVQTVVEE